MSEEQHNFSILFKELERSFDEHEIELSTEKSDEFHEYEEIRALSEIVREIEDQPQNYFAST
jgi:hypothetical protein